MKTGRERIKELVERLESWCWAHTESRPEAIERDIASDLDTLTAARKAAERVGSRNTGCQCDSCAALSELLSILTKKET